jgi:hypothetical protein
MENCNSRFHCFVYRYSSVWFLGLQKHHLHQPPQQSHRVVIKTAAFMILDEDVVVVSLAWSDNRPGR